MAIITDYDLMDDADDQGTWNASGFQSSTNNDSSSNVVFYIENSICQDIPLKKGQTDGYNHCDPFTAKDMTGKLFVFWMIYTIADLDNIPCTALYQRISSHATDFTANYADWDVLAQFDAPYNQPVSGMVPCMAYPTNPDRSSSPTYTAIRMAGFVGSTGSSNDGKYGGHDMAFLISWIGGHSETWTDDFFDDIYDDANPVATIPAAADRPLGVFSKSGNFYQTNVSIQFGDGTSDTANTVVSETGKTIFFSNVEPEQELGYVFVDPNSTYENRLTLTDCVHFWTSQQSTHEIFTDVTNAIYFKLTGCAFTNGGKISLPSDSSNRYVRSTKFSSCQTGTASDGEFTDNILNGCYAMTISGDADFTGTQVLEPAVAADTSGLVWNGNYDPDGNLDNMSFSKGTNAHHAIEFGTSSPLTMTLRDVAFSGFNASDSQNDSTFHVKRTSGTVTINVVGCTGNMSYKSAGATVVVSQSVTVQINVEDEDGSPIAGAQTSVFLEDSPFTEIMNEDTDTSGEAIENYGGSTPVSVVVKVRKSDELDDPRYFAYSSLQTISTSGLTLDVTLKVNPFL